MTYRFLSHVLPAIGCMLALNSCVSTDTLQPEKPLNESEEIVINLSAPAEIKSRATDGYKLRYIAKLVQGTSQNWDTGSNSTILQRKEIIDGENNNTIVFKVTPNSYYGLLVFADYIPEESTANSDGHYPDYFYNTTTYPLRYSMRPTPGVDNDSYLLSADFFNNDNYDCFSNMETIYKTEKEYIVNMTLHRMVAQVIFRENTENTGLCNVNITQLSFIKNFDSNTQSSSTVQNATLSSKLITLSNTIDTDNKDILYYYTFANPTNQSLNTSIGFEVNLEGKEPVTKSLKSIPVQSNYRTIVKSSYVPSVNLEEDPKDDDNDKDGDIILNLTTEFDWEQEPINYEVQ